MIQRQTFFFSKNKINKNTRTEPWWYLHLILSFYVLRKEKSLQVRRATWWVRSWSVKKVDPVERGRKEGTRGRGTREGGRESERKRRAWSLCYKGIYLHCYYFYKADKSKETKLVKKVVEIGNRKLSIIFIRKPKITMSTFFSEKINIFKSYVLWWKYCFYFLGWRDGMRAVTKLCFLICSNSPQAWAWKLLASLQSNHPSWLIQSSFSQLLRELLCLASYSLRQCVLTFWLFLILWLILSSHVSSLFPL